jgi:hypothetical protein
MATRKLIVPTIHLNGSGKAHLTEALQNAADAVRAARDALSETAPHGRDYYVQADPKALSKACVQFTNQAIALEDIEAELAAVLLAIVDGKTEAEVAVYTRLEVL